MTDLQVRECGSGDRLVVFVHGVLDRGRSFDPVVERLEGECRMLLYDRRGYGASAGAPGVPCGIDTHIQDLIAVLDGRRAVVVGHSFGGVSVLGAAVAAPELFASVVLYETVLAWAPGWDDQAMRGVLASDDPAGSGLALMLGDRFDKMTPERREQLYPEGLAFATEEAAARTGVPPFDVASIQAPVVYGCSDAGVAMAGVVRYLRERVGAMELVRFGDAGHHAHRTDPGGFADLIRRGIAMAG